MFTAKSFFNELFLDTTEFCERVCSNVRKGSIRDGDDDGGGDGDGEDPGLLLVEVGCGTGEVSAPTTMPHNTTLKSTLSLSLSFSLSLFVSLSLSLAAASLNKQTNKQTNEQTNKQMDECDRPSSPSTPPQISQSESTSTPASSSFADRWSQRNTAAKCITHR